MKINKLVDAVDEGHVEFAIASTQLLLSSKMPNVISLAWKPSGHRQTVY